MSTIQQKIPKPESVQRSLDFTCDVILKDSRIRWLLVPPIYLRFITIGLRVRSPLPPSSKMLLRLCVAATEFNPGPAVVAVAFYEY